MNFATRLARLLFRAPALLAVVLGLTLIPTLPAQAANLTFDELVKQQQANALPTQANAPQRCFFEVKQNGLQWDPANSAANQWLEPNILNLCADTPAATYPIDCFSAAIRQGLQWPEALGMCTFNTSGCIYTSALSFNVSFAADGTYSGPEATGWDNIIRHCAFGEQLIPNVNAARVPDNTGLFVGTCVQGVLGVGLAGGPPNQDEALNLCSQFEANDQPQYCLGSIGDLLPTPESLVDQNGTPIPADQAIVYLRNLAISICANSLDSKTTVSCVQAGRNVGYDWDTVAGICGAKPQNFANIQIAEPNYRQLNTVQAMGRNCVTSNSISNDGSFDLARGWNACVNQPLFY